MFLTLLKSKTQVSKGNFTKGICIIMINIKKFNKIIIFNKFD
jgi:hypothetical protein